MSLLSKQWPIIFDKITSTYFISHLFIKEVFMQKLTSKFVVTVIILLLLSMSFMSCYGNFSLVKKLYKWNGTVGSKFVNSAITWLLVVIPVYEVAGFIDFIILNVIEYWSGENPVTMSTGEKQTQIVEKNGKKYRITATKNRFDVEEITTLGKNSRVSLIYDEDAGSWYVESNRGITEIAQYDDNHPESLALIFPNNKILNINLTTHPYPLEHSY